MYTTAKTLSVISIILVFINIAGTALTTLFLVSERLDFTQFISLMIYLISATAISLFMAFALRSILQDLEIEVSNHNHNVKKLSDRIKELEIKVK